MSRSFSRQVRAPSVAGPARQWQTCGGVLALLKPAPS
jgi:hypothetical protein